MIIIPPDLQFFDQQRYYYDLKYHQQIDLENSSERCLRIRYLLQQTKALDEF